MDAEHGDVCGIKVVDESDDLMFISSDGVIIRTPCDQIRLMGRVAKGVRVMRVNEGQRVVAFTRTEAAQDETPEADANTALVESAAPVEAPAEAQSVQPEAIPPKPENSAE